MLKPKSRIKVNKFGIPCFFKVFVYIIYRGRSGRLLCFDFGTVFSWKSKLFLWSEKRLLLVCLINISDFCSSMSASGSHRARKRIREAKKKARPGKQKIPPQKNPTPIFWLSWIFALKLEDILEYFNLKSMK